MKKIAIALVLILVLVAISAAAFADTMYINRADKASVKLRNGNDEVIAVIPYGAKVETHSRSKIDSERSEVGYNGQWGWVKTKYLSKTNPLKNSSSSSKSSSSAAATTENVFKNMKPVNHYNVIVHPSKTGSYVNFRWAPSTGAAVIGVRYEGDVLRVIAKNGTWAQVFDDSTGECGYMMLSFLEKIAY